MTTEDLLRKLKPLIPEKVRYWRECLEVADESLKRLIDRQIQLEARERLGDTGQLLLSLPPKQTIRGELHLGAVRYEQPKWPAGLSRDELLQNLAIFGRSGAGKTNVLFHLIEQLCEADIPFVFLDWKRTGRHLIPRLKKELHVYTPGRSLCPFPFNPFTPPPGLEPGTYSSLVVDIIANAFTLGEGAKSIIDHALRTLYASGKAVTPESVLQQVESVRERDRVRGWKISAQRALQTLNTVCTVGAGQDAMIQALLSQSTVVELNGLGTSTKQFLLPVLSLWIYQARLASPARERLNLVLIVEEAHHLLYAHRRQETMMEMLLRQCREIGIAMIIIDQHPHLISSAALGNTYASICLNLKDPTDITTAAKLSQVGSSEAHHFSALPVGRGIIKLQDRWRAPFVVDFPLVEIDKGSITDEHLRKHLGGTLSGTRRPLARENNALAGSRPPDTAEESLLADIQQFPDDGVDVRYQRLGISADKGTRLKRRLLALGLIEEQRVRHGRTQKTLLRPTRHVESGRHESIAHEYWKRHYAQLYAGKGYEVTLEAERIAGGRADVLACREGESLAIEIETGKSDVVENVRRDLLSGYQVLVITPTQRAWSKVWRTLEEAGLAIPQVTVRVADAHGVEK